MVGMMVGKLIAVALACVMTAGCSLVSIGGTDTRFSPPKKPRCHGQSPAILDTLAAVPPALLAAAAGRGLVSGGCKDADEDLTGLCLLAGGIGLGFAVIFGASAAVGYTRASRCSDAHEEYDEWRKANPEEAEAERKRGAEDAERAPNRGLDLVW